MVTNRVAILGLLCITALACSDDHDGGGGAPLTPTASVSAATATAIPSAPTTSPTTSAIATRSAPPSTTDHGGNGHSGCDADRAADPAGGRQAHRRCRLI